MTVDLPVLATADLRRTVLARQLLTERADVELPAALSHVGSLQAQYAPTPYIGLWSRLRRFRRDDLTAALAERQAVQGTMMRSTIHVTAAADYWPLNLAVREARRTWYRRRRGGSAEGVLAAAARTRAAFDDTDVLTRRQLDELAGGFGADVGLFVDLVRVPPSGTWEHRRADRFALAERWVGPEPAITADDARRHLVRHYLRGFGPATAGEIANWAGVNVGVVNAVAATMALARYRAEDGKVLLDDPGLEVAPPTTPLPPRFIGPWEALLLVHARRAAVLAEADRPRIFSVRTPQSFNTFLVGGTACGTWHLHDGRVEIAPWHPLTAAERAAVEDEATRLADFHA